MRLGPSVSAQPEPLWADHHHSGDHCIAELFLPDLRERLHQDPLLPTLWTEARPVRLVSARSILYAAMAIFMADPRAAYARTVDALGRSRRRAVECWLDRLPDHSAQILHPERWA